LRPSLHALCILATMSSPAFAARAHPRLAMRAVAGGAGASSAFDHVPAAAERIAAAFGVVTSTFRTVAHNHAVGGVPNSFHLLGRAIDVARRPGVKHAQIAAALRAAGYALIESLDEGDHSHFAFGGAALREAAPTSGEASPPRPSPAPPGPRLTADDHGSLLADIIGAGRVNGAKAPAVRRPHERRRFAG
jgi:hypothetical protein